MRILRVRHDGLDAYARLLSDAPLESPAPGARAQLWSAAPWAGGQETERVVSLDAASILAPVEPSKIVCVGRNYAEHARELGNEVPKEPLLFYKPPSSLLAHGGVVILPPESERVEHEGEVAVVIGQRIRRASLEEASAAVFGLTLADDVTARDIQRADVQFTRGKSFDTFCPVGPWIETDPGPLNAVGIRLEVGGQTRQEGTGAQMLWPIPSLLAYISVVMTLEPGDLVLTGTPAGVAQLQPGDEVGVCSPTIGRLVHRVAAE